jgi:hypothetical protein
MQRTAETFAAISLAFAKGGLPEAFFDAVALLAEDVENLAWNVNVKRSVEEAKAERGYK